MAEANPPQQIKANHAFVVGRFRTIRPVETQNGRQYIHVVDLPAPDQYTPGGCVEFMSPRQLGQNGGDCQAYVRVTGSTRTAETKNGKQLFVDVRLRGAD